MINNNKFLPFKDREGRAKFTARIFRNQLKNSILDVGCSNKSLKRYIPQNVEYVGVDISGKPDYKVDLEQEKLEIFDNLNFYTVVCTDVLEHIENIHDIFDELCRISQKYVIISLPNNWLNYKFSFISGKGKDKFYGLPVEKPEDRHKWFFNYDQAYNFIKIRAKLNNFKLVKHFSIPFYQNTIKMQLFSIFFRFYYNKNLGYQNLYSHSLWVLLEKVK